MENLSAELKEIARRGHAIYDEKIEPLLTLRDKGKFVAIDVESEEFAMGGTRLLAYKRLNKKNQARSRFSCVSAIGLR